MNELNAGMCSTLWAAGVALLCAILALRHSPDTVERLCCWGIAWAHGKRAERAERERVYAEEQRARGLLKEGACE